MSDVIPLPTSPRHSVRGDTTATGPQSPVATLVAALDRALGDKWSFDIAHHAVVGDETIVFVRLTIEGRSRVGVGGTSENGSLAHRLNAATLDALVRAAEWMGTVLLETAPATADPAAGAMDSVARITRKQLDYVVSLARDRGITRDKLATRCLGEFQRKPEYLTRAQASALIETLRKEVA